MVLARGAGEGLPPFPHALYTIPKPIGYLVQIKSFHKHDWFLMISAIFAHLVPIPCQSLKYPSSQPQAYLPIF